MKEEVFLTTLNEDITNVATEVFIHENLEMCNWKLGEVSWANLDEDNIRTYHGVLVGAKFIPENFKGCTPYILIGNPDRHHSVAIEDEYIFEKWTEDCTEK